MALVFFVFYPIALVTFLDEFKHESKGITDLARNSVFIGNWLLCTLIFVNQTSHSSTSCKVYNRAFVLYVDTVKNQCNSFSIDDTKLAFTAKCALKTLALLIGFTLMNIGKFKYYFDPSMSPFEIVLFTLLFVPNLLMTMASNRFYVATAFVLYLIVNNNNEIKALDEGFRGVYKMRGISLLSKRLSKLTAARINVLAMIHADLHQLFVDFNMIYAKNIVLILGFCFVNVVFEVGKSN